MALPIFRYPLDKTGENPDNYVSREVHDLTPVARPTDVRVAAPIYGPYFKTSLEVRDRANGFVLVPGVDYKSTDLLQDPTISFGKEISQFIVIMNGNVSNSIEISYQVLGGNYQNDSTAIKHVYQTFLNDTRPVDWENISGKPETYPPSLHIHLLEDIVGWGPMIVALDNLRDAVLLNNTPMYEALIDWVNSRKISWTTIVDRPTTLAGYGIMDAVPNSRAVITATNSGLQGGGSLTQDRSISLTNTGVRAGAVGGASKIPVVTVDAQGRVTLTSEVAPVISWRDLTNRPTTAAESGLNDVVPNTRGIYTQGGSGLQGGGNLTQDRNLSLTETGVVAGTYGSATSIPSFNVDAKGRITGVYDRGISMPWSSVSAKPSTVDGFGITDAVKTSGGNQYINGTKTFPSIVTGWGSTAANIDDGAQSMIVSDDYMRRYVAQALANSGGSGSGGTYIQRFGNFASAYGSVVFPKNQTWNNNRILGYLPISFTLGEPMVNGFFFNENYDEHSNFSHLVYVKLLGRSGNTLALGLDPVTDGYRGYITNQTGFDIPLLYCITGRVS